MGGRIVAVVLDQALARQGQVGKGRDGDDTCGKRVPCGSHGERDGWAGTSWVDVVAGTGDVMDFHHLVCAVAQALAAAGDPDPMDALKAKALGPWIKGSAWA